VIQLLEDAEEMVMELTAANMQIVIRSYSASQVCAYLCYPCDLNVTRISHAVQDRFATLHLHEILTENALLTLE
jgi:hypothetical protein